MLKNKKSSSKFALQIRFVAFFVMMMLTGQILSPLTLNFVPVANAQSAGLGNGLLGGGQLSNLQMIGMLMALLMQLFKGGAGGSTPQTGTVDEQPSQLGSGSERFSSGTPSTDSTPSTAPTTSPDAYSASQGIVMFNNTPMPVAVNLQKNGALTISNANATSYNAEVRRAGESTPLIQQTINSGDTKVFRFTNSGNYTFCTGTTGGTLQCSTNVNVSN